MKERTYTAFSLAAHGKGTKPADAIFEVTNACPMRCPHCHLGLLRGEKELSTKDAMAALDALGRGGVQWLAFSGGDPLSRPDFFTLYEYAARLGFILTVFSSGALVGKKEARAFGRMKPFNLEISYLAHDEALSRRTYGVRGALARIEKGIKLLLDEGINLTLKATLTRLNFRYQEKIAERSRKLFGLETVFSTRLYSPERQCGPCGLRVTPSQDAAFSKVPGISHSARREDVFDCVVTGGKSLTVDCEGKMHPCPLIRNGRMSILKSGWQRELSRELAAFKRACYRKGDKCRHCPLGKYCELCPGIAWLETGDMRAAVPHFCEAAGMRKAG